MIEKTKEIDSLLMEIDSQLTERTKVFLIGGGAMMYNALKAYTKDLDMVTTSLKPPRRFVWASSFSDVGSVEEV